MVILGGVIVVLVLMVFVMALWIMSIYNRLVALRERHKNGFAQIDVQLKRRYDLIPNLVNTAKGYMKHESETLEAVVAARNAAYTAEQKVAGDPSNPAAMRDLVGAESQLGGALSRLMAVAEAYPDLKANENMLSLQEELTSTENKVAFARQGFNDAVTQYNTQREQFPAVLFSGMFGFQAAELFELSNEKEREAPAVSF
ncbi:MAG: LemA family protein [Pirellulaceae bacterium]|nr:LemA family protein [Pirellulaceae bacterium]